MSNAEDITISVAQNVLSAVVIATSFRWNSLLPQSDRVVEWVMGLMVAASILAYNIVRIYQSIKDRKK